MISLLLDAALMTLGLAIVSLVGGLLLALLLSAAELSRHVWLRWPVATLTTLIRGLPEILVVLFIYFGSTQVLFLLTDQYVEMSPFWCGVLALALLISLCAMVGFSFTSASAASLANAPAAPRTGRPRLSSIS